MMRKLFLAATFVVFFLPSSSMAASEYSSVLPGLAELYAENAPSSFDKALKGYLQKKSTSRDIKELIGVAVGLLASPGIAMYEANRECMSRGIIAGYSMGVAGGVWEVKPLFVRDRLMLRSGTEWNDCKKTNTEFYNIALIRGYAEVMNLPQEVRSSMRDFLKAFINADQSYLPNYADEGGADGYNYEGSSYSDRFGSLDFYQTYANEFQRRHAIKK